jgi:thiamine-monophosphate kinase
MRSEFDFISHIKKEYDLRRVGDDCAVLPKDPKTDLVITADLLVEDIDFRLDWTTPEFLGHKALAVSLSDVAAMGAKPKWSMLSIGVPEKIWKTKFVDKFYKGWFDLAKQFNVELVGGDVSRTPDKFVVDSIVVGEVAKGRAVQRSGARVGDSIFVTGSLGGSAGGLAALSSAAITRGKTKQLIERHLRPTPRTKIGARLCARNAATAMIDISDGLAADLHHLCDASGVGARVYLDSIPVEPNLDAGPELNEFALAGGEDFELLFTSSRKYFADVDSTPITRIGEITSDTGIVELIVENRATRLPRAGYRHF